MSPSREVCWYHDATIKSASRHCPDSRPSTRAGLGGEQALVDLRRLPGIRRSPSELLTVSPFPLAKQQVVRLPLHLLACREAQPFGTRPPPRARRFPRLCGGQIVPGAPVGL